MAGEAEHFRDCFRGWLSMDKDAEYDLDRFGGRLAGVCFIDDGGSENVDLGCRSEQLKPSGSHDLSNSVGDCKI